MERQQADNLLKSHSSGTYLIRERTAEAERFAISIKYVSAGQLVRRAGGQEVRRAASLVEVHPDLHLTRLHGL